MERISHAKEKETSLKDIISPYTRYWYLFILGIIIAAGLAYVYLYYSTSLYRSQGTVIIKDERSGEGSAELAALSGLGNFISRYQSNRIENEIAIFTSKRIIKSTIEALDLNILYESIGTFKASELYSYRPFKVQYLSKADSIPDKGYPKLFFQVKSETTFELQNESGQSQGEFLFGERVSLPFGDITVIPNLDNKSRFLSFTSKLVAVTHRDPDKMAFAYQRKLNVANTISNSNVVSISMETEVREKAEDFINELVFQYDQDAKNDRSQIAKKTSDFIDTRLEIITKELDSVEENKVSFKSSNRLTNIEAQAQLVLENASEFEKRQFNVTTQLELVNTMIDYMENTSSNDLLPSNIGLEGADISQSVNNYNELILERNRLLKSSTAKNPVVVNVNNQIEEIRSNVRSSLENTANTLKISLRDLNYQENQLNSKLYQVPSQEKIYRGIERQQSIKEQLYLYLLQQREEASISLAVTASKAKVVDRAYSSNAPVSPNRLVIWSGALLAGFLVPFLFLYVRQQLNDRVTARKDLEKAIPSINLIGEIPKLRKDEDELVRLNDRSVLAESFRILRTNLQYLFINKLEKEQKTNTVFVTSTVKGEGKTFVAFNLALTIALTGKKVVLVGADIRNPQLHRYIPKEEQHFKGLTEFIVDHSVQLKDITAHSAENENLSIILSGAIPPNPAELLMENRTKEFFEEVRSLYDYVIVDTAPSMLVTDTILINHMADVTLYVFRAGYTEKKLLDFVCDALDDGRLSNVAGVLNNVSMNNFGYGNKYGYAYHQETTPWHKRLFKR